MKRILIALVGFMMTSCVPFQYCQMYQTKPISGIQLKEDALVYEDDNCVVYYNFWKEHGEKGFVIYNKKLENIYLHLEECVFIENGYAYDYYQNGTFSSSLIGSSVGEKRVIVVPPETKRSITEFGIKNEIFRSCDLLLNPGKGDPNSLSFTKDDTPLTFGNIITYSVGESEKLFRVNNEFYVSKITNYRIDQITKSIIEERCGVKQINKRNIRVFKESGPDQFYIWYIPRDKH